MGKHLVLTEGERQKRITKVECKVKRLSKKLGKRQARTNRTRSRMQMAEIKLRQLRELVV